MGSINYCSDQNMYQHSYSYNSTPAYEYSQKSPLREIDSVDTGDTRLLLLINSAYYFLECVYILCKKSSYRLVVLHNSRVLTYRDYRTLRGAKIAFQKIYKNKAWKEGVKASWIPPAGGNGNQDLLTEQAEIAANKPLKAYSI